jgi:hypothetical protein
MAIAGRADVMVTAARDHLVAGKHVARPQAEPDAEAQESDGPQHPFSLVLRSVHVRPGETDAREKRERPAERYAHLGAACAPGVVFVTPVAVILAPRYVVRPGFVRLDAEVARVL